MTSPVLRQAITEARRRQAASERDLSSAVDHFARSLGPVCERWHLAPERWLDGGSGLPVLAVTTSDGVDAVLKVAEPGELDVAASVMQAADGHGYARVLDWDAAHGALLLERLGTMLSAQTSKLAEQGPVIVSLLREAWRVPSKHGQPFGGKAVVLLSILADLGPRYGSAHRDLVERATLTAKQLAAAEQPEVVCHGDAHANNVLRRAGGWALIDPDGFVGERSYDVGVVLRDACAELKDAESSSPGAAATLLRSQCRQLAELADVDPDRVWDWAFVERVTSGLYLHWHGYAEESAAFLDTARLLVP